MRPPHADAASPPISLRRDFLRQNLAQVAVGEEQVRHRNIAAGLLRRPGFSDGIFLFPLGRRRRSRSVLLRRRRQRHEEVNLAAPELRFGRHDDDPRAHPGFRRRRRLLEDVFGVQFHNLRRRYGAADFFDAAVGVDNSDHVECAAWQNARYAAPDGVNHGCWWNDLLLLLSDLN